MKFRSSSLSQTESLAKKLALSLSQGSVLCLSGTLGAGKSTFTRAFGKARGVAEFMTSPSYPLILEYDTAGGPLFHLDMYRITHEDEALEIGFEEILDPKHLVLIEWPEKIPNLIPDKAIWLYFEITGPDSRDIEITNLPESSKVLL